MEFLDNIVFQGYNMIKGWCMLPAEGVTPCSILRHVFLMLTAHTIINTVTGKIHLKLYYSSFVERPVSRG